MGVSYRYDPWGVLDASNGAPTDATAAEIGYTGGLLLSEDLLLLGTRAYAPKWRRFLQPDAFDWRRYTYVHGDPLNLVDPSGLDGEVPGVTTQVIPNTGGSPDNLSYTIGIRAFARGAGLPSYGIERQVRAVLGGYSDYDLEMRTLEAREEREWASNRTNWNVHLWYGAFDALTLSAAGAVKRLVTTGFDVSASFGASGVRGAGRQFVMPDRYEGVRLLSTRLRQAGVPRKDRLDVIQSFVDTKITGRVAGGGENVLRFFGGTSRPLGRFVTPAFPQGSAWRLLALPNRPTGLTQFFLRSGAEYFEGTVAANFGLPGGGVQYFVPDLADLLPVVGGF